MPRAFMLLQQIHTLRAIWLVIWRLSLANADVRSSNTKPTCCLCHSARANVCLRPTGPCTRMYSGVSWHFQGCCSSAGAEEGEGIRPSHFRMSQILNELTTESYYILSKASSFAFLYGLFKITCDNKWPFEIETILNKNSNETIRSKMEH